MRDSRWLNIEEISIIQYPLCQKLKGSTYANAEAAKTWQLLTVEIKLLQVYLILQTLLCFV